MLKIPLSVERINALLRWRDEYKELARACVVPFPSCEISSENGMGSLSAFEIRKSGVCASI